MINCKGLETHNGKHICGYIQDEKRMMKKEWST